MLIYTGIWLEEKQENGCSRYDFIKEKTELAGREYVEGDFWLEKLDGW